MKTVVTGAGGFIGRALAKSLLSSAHTVAEINRVNLAGLFSDLNLATRQDMKKIAVGLEKYNPDVIFHLASNTSINASWESPFEFISANIELAENLLEAIELSGTQPLLVLLSSSAVYDDSNEPIPETFRLAPSSPYAISKLSTENIALRYYKTIIIRPFFTMGAGRRGDVIDEWLSAINEIRLSGSHGVLKVGDLALERDYLDVDESVRLLIEIAEKGSPGEIYNLCSGVSNSLQRVCESLIEFSQSASLISIRTTVKRDSTLKLKVVGDTSKLTKLGIHPVFNLDASIGKIVKERRDLKSLL
jgi:GDP-4-dehydro-6-deoxy-D-mannose reductase